MTAVPVLPAVTGGTYTTSQVSAIIAAVDFFQRKPIAQVRQISAQTLTTGTWAAITFTAEDIDSDPAGGKGHSTSVNTSRYTANYPGRITASGCVSFAASATGQRATRWAVNGSPLDGSVLQLDATAANEMIIPVSAFSLFLNVGDYVELQAWQNTGGNLATLALGNEQSRMTVGWERLT